MESGHRQPGRFIHYDHSAGYGGQIHFALFYDNQAAAPATGNLGFVDTGENGSYGDFGLSMYKAKSLDLAFEMYFLPTRSTRPNSFRHSPMVEKPVLQYSPGHRRGSRPAMVSPESYLCVQNYPNKLLISRPSSPQPGLS
jgi:hypothetical protein